MQLSAEFQNGRGLVSLTNASEAEQTVNASYELFDPNSVRTSEGAVGSPRMRLKPGEVVECVLTLEGVDEKVTHALKLPAATETGERDVELFDYGRR